jgi:hypothetical protein
MIELEFRNVDFCGGRKTGEPGENPLKQGSKRINNKLVPSVCTTAHSICNSIETKDENNRLEAKQYPAMQRNLTKNTIDSGT